tara:strand:- start:167 stop:634 length:468 start_codon:yes stop_codon:yes gene_type:complete
MISGAILAILVAISVIKPDLIEGEPKPYILEHCIFGHTTSLESHYHPYLSIYINGEKITLPDETGVEPGCMRMIHTHEGASGKLHVEKEDASLNVTIGDFFHVWGETFNENQILGYKVDSTHEIIMKVDGVVNTEYQNYEPKDGENIVIEYNEIS